MNKTKEQLAEEALDQNIRNRDGGVFLSESPHLIAMYIAGYEAAEPKWIPFNDETGKYLNTLDNPLLLFDNGQTCRYDDDHPFAIMTHFLPIPELPE